MKPKSIPLIQTDRPDCNAATSGMVSVHRDDHLDSTRLQNVPLTEDLMAEWLFQSKSEGKMNLNPYAATWEPKPNRQDVTWKSVPNQSSDILQHLQNRPTGDRWLKL